MCACHGIVVTRHAAILTRILLPVGGPVGGIVVPQVCVSQTALPSHLSVGVACSWCVCDPLSSLLKVKLHTRRIDAWFTSPRR